VPDASSSADWRSGCVEMFIAFLTKVATKHR
jgi:hypothetical protein